jgi:hypothetical protein
MGQLFALGVAVFWGCFPACPSYCVIEELDYCPNVFFSFKGNF